MLTININGLNYKVLVYFGQKEVAAFVRAAKRKRKVDIELEPKEVACTVENLIFLDPLRLRGKKPSAVNLIRDVVHEVSHAVTNMFEYLVMENPDDETRAYVNDYVVGKVLDKLVKLGYLELNLEVGSEENKNEPGSSAAGAGAVSHSPRVSHLF